MTQENTRIGTTTSYATGTICPKTGSYKTANKYMETIVVVAKNTKFPAGSDGSKVYWTPLSSTDSSRTSFESVKVSAGTV